MGDGLYNGSPYAIRPLSVCLSVLSLLSVCDVRALWLHGWTDQDETWHAGRPVGHIVLDGDPAPPPQRGTAPPPISGPYLLRPNGCIDQDVTWYRARPRPRRLCVRWGPRSLSRKGAKPSTKPSAHVYCGQTAGCIKMPLVCLSPGDFVLDGDSPSSPTRGQSPLQKNSSHVYCGKRLDGSRCHLAQR